MQNVAGQEGIDFAYRLNRQLVEGPMANYPGRFHAFATLQLQSPEAALALALTIVACRRAGLERPTLVRDESGAALDPANARAYVAMLRRAATNVEASHVLVVSQRRTRRC